MSADFDYDLYLDQREPDEFEEEWRALVDGLEEEVTDTDEADYSELVGRNLQ